MLYIIHMYIHIFLWHKINLCMYLKQTNQARANNDRALARSCSCSQKGKWKMLSLKVCGRQYVLRLLLLHYLSILKKKTCTVTLNGSCSWRYIECREEATDSSQKQSTRCYVRHHIPKNRIFFFVTVFVKSWSPPWKLTVVKWFFYAATRRQMKVLQMLHSSVITTSPSTHQNTSCFSAGLCSLSE